MLRTWTGGDRDGRWSLFIRGGGLKIGRFALPQLRMPLVHFFETSFSRTSERQILIVEVVSEGLSGWGEITAGEHPFYKEEWAAAAWLDGRGLGAPRLSGAG